MEAIIINYRGSGRVKKNNQLIIQIGDKAKEYVGKTAVWTSTTGKEIKGKVTSIHGNKGAVRALFERGLPGQCLGKKIKVE